ncbi:MAG: manganese efflux pump MntP family protein [Defluviitaleaceae bacterium]|nr:manganese efflux pump MntP family protein [Defluviitaleaceae bacterium]
MGYIELVILAVGLAMDAFAVAVSIGLTMARTSYRRALIVGLYFGVFQAGMPLAGYFAARHFAEHVNAFSHWISFGLLLFLGGKMIWGSFKKETCLDRKCPEPPNRCADRVCPNQPKEITMHPRQMIPLSLATSIDAMAVGVSFAFLYVNLIPAVSLIGIITLVLSAIGVRIGNLFGEKLKNKATIIGGVILILIGINILWGAY